MKNESVITIEKNGKKYTGVPYEDFLTFSKWRSLGRKVKKGEKACYKSITFIKKEDEAGKTLSFPKVYHLFHCSQVA